MNIFVELADNEPSGCSWVVRHPRALIDWLDRSELCQKNVVSALDMRRQSAFAFQEAVNLDTMVVIHIYFKSLQIKKERIFGGEPCRES
jgi:hypothetical protein